MELTVNSRRAGIVAALGSVLLGLTSVGLLHLLAGIPALALGLWGLRRLNALRGESDVGPPWGPRLALAGMALGGAGCLLGVLGLLSLGLLRLGESRRRLECANNLRQIGKAVALYHDFYKQGYPQATLNVDRGAAVIVPWLRDPYPKRLSWLVNIRPFLQSEKKVMLDEDDHIVVRKDVSILDLHYPFQTDRAWDAPENEKGVDTVMRVYQCPSHPRFNPFRRPALGHYVGMTGMGPDAVELPLASPDAGFFGYERRLTEKHLLRGQSYTLLATETMMDNGPWAAGGLPTVRGLDREQQPYIGYERPFGGLHPEGVNLLMVDSSVRFVTPHARPYVLENMTTLSGEDLDDH